MDGWMDGWREGEKERERERQREREGERESALLVRESLVNIKEATDRDGNGPLGADGPARGSVPWVSPCSGRCAVCTGV